MGDDSNPIKAIVDTAAKAIGDTGSTLSKGVGDVTKSVTDRVNPVLKHIGDMGAEAGRVGSGKINLDPFNKQKEAAKDQGRADARQRSAAQATQEQNAQDQIRQNAANKDANSGSAIILGGKRKKKKGGSVSSGMGLSTGSTGLQT